MSSTLSHQMMMLKSVELVEPVVYMNMIIATDTFTRFESLTAMFIGSIFIYIRLQSALTQQDVAMRRNQK